MNNLRRLKLNAQGSPEAFLNQHSDVLGYGRIHWSTPEAFPLSRSTSFAGTSTRLPRRTDRILPCRIHRLMLHVLTLSRRAASLIPNARGSDIDNSCRKGLVGTDAAQGRKGLVLSRRLDASTLKYQLNSSISHL